MQQGRIKRCREEDKTCFPIETQEHVATTSTEQCIKLFFQGGDALTRIEVREAHYLPLCTVKRLLEAFCKRRGVPCVRSILPSMLPIGMVRTTQQVCRVCGRKTQRRSIKHEEDLFCRCEKRGDYQRTKKTLILNVVAQTRVSEKDEWQPVDFHFVADSLDVTTDDEELEEEKTKKPRTAELRRPCISSAASTIDPLHTNYVILVPEGSATGGQQSMQEITNFLGQRICGKSYFRVRVLVLFSERSAIRRLDPMIESKYHVQYSSWCQSSASAYGYEQSLYNMGEVGRLIRSGAPWSSKDSFDLVIVWDAHKMSATTCLFFEQLLLQHPRHARPCMCFVGEASYRSCSKPYEHISDIEPNSRYLLLAQDLFQDYNSFPWQIRNCSSTYRYVSHAVDNNPIFLEKLRSLVEEEELAPFEPILLECWDPCVNLIGSAVPLAYKHRSLHLQTWFAIKPLRDRVWDKPQYRAFRSRFETLCASSTPRISNCDRAFLYLCYFIESSPKYAWLLTVAKLVQHDWLTPFLDEATPRFNAIGLHNQERSVCQDPFIGHIDGLTKEGAVVELKFRKREGFAARVQVLLYHCMMKMTEDDNSGPNYCEYYNWRSGRRSKLSCRAPAEFFRDAIKLCSLTSYDQDFLLQHRRR